MDTSGSLNVLIGLCAVALVIGLVVGILAYLTTSTARNERRGRLQQHDVPPVAFPVNPPSAGQSWRPETLPPPWPEDLQPESRPDGRIRFAQEPQAFTPPSSSRLKWGDVQPIINLQPPSPDEQQRCPVCRNSPPREADGIKCKGCGTIYHRECWEILNQSCRICERTVP